VSRGPCRRPRPLFSKRLASAPGGRPLRLAPALRFGATPEGVTISAVPRPDAPGLSLPPGKPASCPYVRGATSAPDLAVHMNGRIYDPTIGRFLSADPYVGDAADAQEYNRYSYLGNDPLGGTDPSGFFSLKDAAKIVAIVAIAYVTGGWGAKVLGGWLKSAFAISSATGSTITAGVGGGFAAGFSSGFAGSLLNGGSLSDAFKAGAVGGVVGAVTGGILGKIGTMEWNPFQRGLAHGATHGVAAEAQGGEFRHGFYAGFAVGATEARIGEWAGASKARGIAAASVVGGTASALGGGKFANGAISGAFSYLFNQLSEKFDKTGPYNWDQEGDNLVLYSRRELGSLSDGVELIPERNKGNHAILNLDDAERSGDVGRYVAEKLGDRTFDRVVFVRHGGVQGEMNDRIMGYLDPSFAPGRALHTAVAPHLRSGGSFWSASCYGITAPSTISALKGMYKNAPVWRNSYGPMWVGYVGMTPTVSVGERAVRKPGGWYVQ
jgi:RHS repeat-associated protein